MTSSYHRHHPRPIHLVALIALLFATFASLLVAPPRALAASTLVQWNFNSTTPDANTGTGVTTPASGSGSAALSGTTATFASGDANGGSSDPAVGDDSGWNISGFAAQGTANETRGAQFSLSTGGQQDIVVSWDQRHSNTSSRFVRFQYSVDGTTFVSFGPLFEGTSGDTWFNARSVDLTSIAAVNNNPNFAFRIVAAFAPSTSAYAASGATATYGTTSTWRFDMVTVSSNSLAAAPTITTQPASQTISAGQTATLTVVASGTAPLSYQWYEGSAGDTSAPVGTNSASFTTPAISASTSYWVRVTNSAGSADSATATITVTPAGPTITKIDAVQGAGAASPLVGQIVTVDAIVVGDYQGQAGTELRGFFVQEQDADADADAATSEGIFVFCDTCVTAVSVGDNVQVTGAVSEFFNMTQINATTAASVVVVSAGNSLPTPASLTLPVPGVTGTTPTTAAPQINAYFEQSEGMLARFPVTLSVAEYFELARYGQIVLSQGGRPRQSTDLRAPSTASYAQSQVDQARRTIILDDLNNSQNFATAAPDKPYFWPRPGLSITNFLRGGDTIANLTGVLHWSFAGQSGTDAWRIRPVEPAFSYAFTSANPRPAAPALPGGLKVGAYNVLNLFLTPDTTASSSAGPCGASQTLDCRGPDSAAESLRQRAKLTQALASIDADALGLIELENTPGVDPAATIAGDLNDAVGAGSYAAIATGVIGGDAIRVGIIYRPGKVTPVGPFKTLDKTIDPRFNSDIMRPSLAQTFQVNATGEIFTLVVNHLKSKGSCPASGPDADQLDGQGCWNPTRTSAAQAVADWIKTDPTGSGDPDFLVVGDMNAYRKEDPISAFKQAGLVDLIDTKIGAAAYSYLFNAQLGYLDHALATPSLAAQVAGVDEWHINADESDLLDYNDTVKDVGEGSFERKSTSLPLYEASPYRTSDHDPVLVGMDLRPLARVSNDSYTAEADATLSIGAAQGVLANDSGAPLSIIGSTGPSNGTLTLGADGSFSYTPNPGFTGTDSFTYTVGNTATANAVQVYSTRLPPLGTFGGVSVGNDGFGSALAPVPGTTDEFYGLTDRGPNVDGPNGSKIEPVPSFTPAIGRVKFVNGQAILQQTIPLQAADGTPYNGQVNTQANTGETITDLDGNVLPASPYGYDSEGLVALPDGTFWVSDEYGPFITHFDANGKQIARLSPYDATLPAELQKRVINRGMEGLTITPDGSTLVGIMQSALQQSDLNGFDAKKLSALRIVTYTFATGALREYIYLRDTSASTSVSEITALSNTTFLVDERDGNFLPNATKKLYLIDIADATDVGPSSTVAGASYSAVSGLLIGGKSIELLVKGLSTSASATALGSAGIAPVSKRLYLDLGALLLSIDPQGRFFAHDKIEGVVALNGGTRLVIANDSDFGIDGITNAAAPFQLRAKTTPAGVQDFGEYLVVDLTTSTATVTIDVRDTGAPETTIDSAPTDPSNSATASFTFSGSDGGAGVTSFECALDGASFTACTSPQTYSGLADGSHTFAVRAIDRSGNVDATPASFSWIVDTTAPAVTITSQPANPTNSGAASFTFSATDAGTGVASIECKLDDASFAACTSPQSYSGLAKGDHTFTVRATDNAGNVSAGTSYSWTIAAAQTTTSFTTSANPAVTGQTVVFTANVAVVAPGVGTPDGTVAFLSGGAPIAGCGAVALSGGTAQCSTSFATAGNYTISVAYSGGEYFLASASAPGVQAVKTASAVTVTSSGTPSVFGQSVTFTASVTAGVRPTGSVTFLDGTTVLATRSLSASGGASYSTSSLSVGSHIISVVYNGSAGVGGSVSPSITQVVNQASTTTALSASPSQAVAGQRVKLTATTAVVAPGAGKPSGTVTFYDGATAIGSASLISGKATLSVNLSVGSHAITAVYSGSANFSGSTSPTLTVTVGQATTTITLSSSQNPATFGKRVIFTATIKVVSPGSGAPSGTVTFYDGATALGTVAVSGSKAAFTTVTLAVGSHAITAVYSGDASLAGSTSNVVAQTIR